MSSTARKIHSKSQTYDKLRSIDGDHPLKKIPGTYVEYEACRRKNGKVVYFNFDLAKEMGLIDKNHPHKITRELHSAILDTFAIQIINEYDIINDQRPPKQDIKPKRYMATRYLQLQHPNKIGLTSGDGRSIWNGYVEHRGTTWDVSSCGTGATCLSPATAINGKFYETGDPSISYGCGYSETAEGIGNSIFSEVLHLNNIPTERCLLVIEFPKGLSINVRAGKNLLRPSHMFNHLKQENLPRLQAVVDFFIDRQTQNGLYDKVKVKQDRYNYFLEQMCETFAEISARFETEYIFCWLDWDGDNILADGGIIDYGSIRQFGLFHHEYRFDDVERWSTTITEQKNKARYTIQTIAQLVHYIKSGKKKPISQFSNHRILKYFDKHFANTRKNLLLQRIGINEKDSHHLITTKPSLVRTFIGAFDHFERTVSKEGSVRIEDGVTTNAVFCMRDILRELPGYLLDHDMERMSPKEFIEVMKSAYALKKDLTITPYRTRQVSTFQTSYIQILEATAKFRGISFHKMLNIINERSAIINRYERVTGDAVIHVTNKILSNKKKMNQEDMQKLIESFIKQQVLVPEKAPKVQKEAPQIPNNSKKLMNSILRIVKTYREGL